MSLNVICLHLQSHLPFSLTIYCLLNAKWAFYQLCFRDLLVFFTEMQAAHSCLLSHDGIKAAPSKTFNLFIEANFKLCATHHLYLLIKCNCIIYCA